MIKLKLAIRYVYSLLPFFPCAWVSHPTGAVSLTDFSFQLLRATILSVIYMAHSLKLSPEAARKEPKQRLRQFPTPVTSKECVNLVCTHCA